MKVYRLETTQRVPDSLENAWQFFSDPRKLKEITPARMGFTITSPMPEQMYEGMIISYVVRPLLGIPVQWVTEITHVVEGRMFVDEQRFGPYRFWHHEHHFSEIPGGVEMRDIVYYVVPYGWMGRLANFLFVRTALDRVFAYRKEAIARRFGELP
jgi:ligand-binding SRPBCC domain-containing protein